MNNCQEAVRCASVRPSHVSSPSTLELEIGNQTKKNNRESNNSTMTTKEPTLPSTTSTPDKLPSYPPPPSFSDYLSLESLTPKPLLLSKEEDEKSTILPSFYDLRRKNHQTLYGSGDSKDDKSPKGSVDEPIRPLVDLINKHSDYCTLSSCSGRISLFDPNQQHLQRGDERETTIRNESSDNGTKRTASGKGTGGWLLVSHYPIHPNELVTCFENSTFFHTKHQPQKAWIFKLEPLVLHVAASSLHRGQQLLRLGLELGFRESGLVVSDKRVTVAIRGHSLALSIPCLPGGSLSLPKDYWTSLVNTQANPRLIQNWNQLDRLYRSIRLNWFDVSPTRLIISSSSSTINTISSADTISSLNLWDMATVHTATTSNARKVDDIWCFGGYGIGPNPTNSNSQRSSNVYRLRQIQKDCTDNNGDLDERNQSNDQDWELINVVAPENQTPPCWQFITGGLQVSWQSKFPSCQGMAACQLSNGWIVIWGGRTSPTKPQNTLYLWDSIRHMLATPLSSSIKGTLPAPRWGHSLVAISNNRAVLVGGCNQDHGAMDDIHLLIWDEQDGSFFWERLAMSLPSPRFHHMTTRIQTKNGICDDDDDIILVLGGLRSTTDVLGCVSKNENENAGLIWAFQIEETKLLETKATASGNVNTRKQEEHRRIPSTRVRHWNVSKEGLPKTLSSRWGSATCQIYSNNNPIMVVSGGITPIDGDDDDDDSVTLPPLEAFFLTKQKYQPQDTIHVTCVPTDITSINSIQTSETELIDFGSLVHHSCIAISENEFLLLGGGVASFAFGDCFAKSHRVRVVDSSTCTKQDLTKGGGISSVKNRGSTANKNKNATGSTGSAMDKDNDPKKSAIIKVVYVTPKLAKTVKKALERHGWLDKGFRMIKLPKKEGDKEEQMIAIPVTDSFSWDTVCDSDDWDVLGQGQEEMPYSTAKFAAAGTGKR